MAWKCDVCDQSIHLKKVDGRNYPVRCPLEKYKNVKLFHTQELKQMLSYVFFDYLSLSDDPEDLKKFSEMIPDETPILDYVKKVENKRNKTFEVFTKTLILQGSMETFFKHLNRVLIHIYDDNHIHFVDSPQVSKNEQFNYLWLSPTALRECYFRTGRKDSRFKSMTELGNPSLVIYPIGNVMSVNHVAWGDILLDLITHRQSLGKPTWLVKTKEFKDCPETVSSEKLRTFLTRSSAIPTVILDPDEKISIVNNSPATSGGGINSYGF